MKAVCRVGGGGAYCVAWVCRFVCQYHCRGISAHASKKFVFCNAYSFMNASCAHHQVIALNCLSPEVLHPCKLPVFCELKLGLNQEQACPCKACPCKFTLKHWSSDSPSNCSQLHARSVHYVHKLTATRCALETTSCSLCHWYVAGGGLTPLRSSLVLYFPG